MTLKEFKKTNFGKYAVKAFNGEFKTDADVEDYKAEILELTSNGDYESVYEFCQLEAEINGANIDTSDVYEFINAK